MTRSEEHLPLGVLADEVMRIRQALTSLETSLLVTASAGGRLLSRLLSAAAHLDAAAQALRGAENEAERPSDLSGSSRSVPIQDLLSFLSTTKKSGLLRVAAPGERFLLQLEEGAVVYAFGDAPPSGEELGELLIGQGTLTQEQLELLPEHRAQSAWLDPALLETGWISRESLGSALASQTKSSFFRLCSVDDARYTFYEGARVQNLVEVRHNAVELLLEFSRVSDEAERRGTPEYTALAALPRDAGALAQ